MIEPESDDSDDNENVAKKEGETKELVSNKIDKVDT